MKFLARGLFGLMLFAIMVAAAGYGGWRVHTALNKEETRRKSPVAERTYAVNVARLVKETAQPVTTAYGQIESWRDLQIRASSEGRLVEVAETFRDGAAVHKGDLLLKIDPADAESKLLDAKAGLADAEAQKAEAEEAVVVAEHELQAAEKQLQLRRQALDRQTQLREKGYSTAVQVEQEELSVAALEQALNNRLQSVITARRKIERMDLTIQRAQIALRDAERMLEETTITAPFDGTLDSVAATLGRRVSPSETLAVLIDPKALEVRFTLSNRQFARFLDDRGQLLKAPVTVSLELGDRAVTVSGRLSRAAAKVSEGEAGRSLYAALDVDAETVLRPGDFVTVRLEETPLPGVARIPAAAATEDGRVLVVNDENRLDEVTAQILRRMDEELLVAGVPFGRSYVRERLPHLGAGLKVSPRHIDENQSGTPVAAAEELITLDAERREALIERVKSSRMPEDRKSDVIGRLSEPQVPRSLIERIESGGRNGQRG